MCRHFFMLTLDELEGIIKELRFDTPRITLPDWPARHIDAFPRSEVPLIVSRENEFTAHTMRWGYPVSWSKGPIFNTRSDTALGSPETMWRESLDERRCIVPAWGFFESHRTETSLSLKTGKKIKRQYLFTPEDNAPLFLAGIYEADHFSLMTTEPNAVVSPIHDRMPVILEPRTLRDWLWGDYTSLLKGYDGEHLSLTANSPEPKTLFD